MFWYLNTCKDRNIHSTNVDYWRTKLKGNVQRDRENDEALVKTTKLPRGEGSIRQRM